MEQGATEYSTWSPDKLLERIQSLEKQLKTANEQLQKLSRTPAEPAPVPKRSPRPFDASKYSTRPIALKFAYLGQRYNGFEHHNNNKTRMPAVEEVLWKALVKGKFISPPGAEAYSPRAENEFEAANISWEGCEYSKCGRTDRGVSAFGQVIGIRVRSNRPVKKEEDVALLELDAGQGTADVDGTSSGGEGALLDMPAPDSDGEVDGVAVTPEFHDIHDELPYVQILNRLLPPDIRVLAWCPAPDDFSARFSCRERRYRYFFTQPAFNPTPGAAGLTQGATLNASGERRRDGWLDIEAMKIAAKKYEGLHDFRNMCKVDASKQLENFTRRIFVSEIREVDSASEPAAYIAGKEFAEFGKELPAPTGHENGSSLSNSPKVYQFVLHGSAFLWHQVRHMVAILFLIGQGLEQPALIDELLDTTANPCKPQYEMADDAPLVLWDCVFPDENSSSREDSLPWIWVGDEFSQSSAAKAGRNSPVKSSGKFGHGGVVDELWQLWRKRKMDEILAGSLLNLASQVGGVQPPALQLGRRGEVSRYVFQGGDGSKSTGVYVPVMQKLRQESVEVINKKYRERRGIEAKGPSQAKETRGDHS